MGSRQHLYSINQNWGRASARSRVGLGSDIREGDQLISSADLGYVQREKIKKMSVRNFHVPAGCDDHDAEMDVV